MRLKTKFTPSIETTHWNNMLTSANAIGPILGKGGSIHIKPENRGKFTAYANSKGMSVQQAASSVLSDSSASETLRKRAQFAKNAASWNKNDGGKIDPRKDPARRVFYIENSDDYYIDDAGNLISKTKEQNDFFKQHNFDRKLDQFRKKQSVPNKRIPMLADGGTIGDPNKPLVEISPTDPRFTNQREFDKYYRAKAESVLQQTDPDLYSKYQAAIQSGDVRTAQSYIALRGGLPKFVPTNPLKDVQSAMYTPDHTTQSKYIQIMKDKVADVKKYNKAVKSGRFNIATLPSKVEGDPSNNF